ncbi:MAG: sensor histidine kinase [Chloroflexota bacterium]|nr:sensor histidine kinase [Chloroflexota bacterium]
MIGNLLTNALKYSPPSSPVVVRLKRVGQQAVIAVVDQGVGIPAADLPHLFEKHYRASTAGTTVGTAWDSTAAGCLWKPLVAGSGRKARCNWAAHFCARSRSAVLDSRVGVHDVLGAAVRRVRTRVPTAA